MFCLTREGTVDSGAYASIDDDGHPIVQFFVDKDDATMYNVHLEALGQDLAVISDRLWYWILLIATLLDSGVG